MGCERLTYKKNKTPLKVAYSKTPFFINIGDSKKQGSPKKCLSAYKYKYNGQELEEEFGKNTYAYQWRDYDPAIARFNKIDRFAKKYDDLTPYHFVANNPVIFREIAGDSIGLSSVTDYDRARNTNHRQTIVNSLQNVTGLSLSVNANGNLVFAKDANGNAVVSTTTDANGNTTNNGSSSARSDLISSIGDNVNDNVEISISTRSVTNPATSQIGISPSQINNFINGTPTELNSATMGFGLTVLHEIRHTDTGGNSRDPSNRNDTSSTGPVVDRVNVYRAELDRNPQNAGAKPYGQRKHYNATPNGSGTGGSVGFRYQTQNRRGRTVKRTKNINF